MFTIQYLPILIFRPYHGVIAERKIRNLQGQVKNIRSKKLIGRPKLWNAYEEEEEDDLHMLDEPHRFARSRKECEDEWMNSLHQVEPTARSSMYHPSSPKTIKFSKYDQISAQEFLDASLTSLEAIKRQTLVTMPPREYEKMDRNGVGGDLTASPSTSYLKGAIWLGRNILMLTEEMVSQMELFRSRYLREVSLIASDNDSARGVHRLSLLATSGITEVLNAINQTRTASRDILQVNGNTVCLYLSA